MDKRRDLFIILPIYADEGDAEHIRQLSECYRQLPDMLKLVLLLCCYDGFSSDEVAGMLECGGDLVSGAVRKACLRFSLECGRVVAPEGVGRMLTEEIDSSTVPEEVSERVKMTLSGCEDPTGSTA